MRRIFATITAVTLAGSTVLVALPANAAEVDLGDLTVLATTDIHGYAVDYDYFTGSSFGAKDPSKALGMDHLATAIKQVRSEKGADSTLLLDNGDGNQGSSLETYYHANRQAGDTNPMASVFNLLGYDAGVLGNHEFNYGPADLAQYQSNLNHPLLGANVIDVATGKPAFTPYVTFDKTVGGEQVKVAVVGVVTPGVATWDKATVEGKLEFQDASVAANKYAAQAKAEGADVVVVLAHTGLDAEGYVYNAADKNENIAKSVAEQSTDIDVVIGGHSHVTDKAQEYFTNKNGEKVLFSQPGYWARFASQVEIPLTKDDATGEIDVEWSDDEQPTAVALKASDYAQDPSIQQTIEPWYTKTTEWVKTVVAQSTETMKADTSAWEDTAIVDFINKVQTDEVTRALKGSEYKNLPVLAEASPFSRTAVFNKGDVTIADMAGLYIYDNTLYAVKLNGTQLKDYLEWSARYYQQQAEGAQINDWASVTNAMYDGATRGIPDYSYDVLSGVNYHINISKPVGERIENLALPDGTAVTDDTEVILALNNYRWSGGSGYPHVTAAPIVYNEQKAVRDLMIDWAIQNKTIDPATFFEKNWTVSTSAAEVAPEPAPTGEPTVAPTAEPTAQQTETTDPTAAPSESASAEATESAVAAPSSSVAASESTSAAAETSASPVAEESEPAAAVAENNGSGTDNGVVTSESAPSEGLAYTGANVLAVGGIALALLVAGGLLVGARRRKA